MPTTNKDTAPVRAREQRPLLTRPEVAILARLSERQIMRDCEAGLMPRPVIHRGKVIRFNPDQIDAWMCGEWVPPRKSRPGRRRAQEQE